MAVALVDLYAAFCSMIASMEPSLRGKPLVVTSSGDGIIVAINREAKALGPGMSKFEPLHQELAKLTPAQRAQLVIRSSTFEHFSEFSRRFVDCLKEEFGDQVVQYSIDESFIFLPDNADLWEVGRRVRRDLWRTLKLGAKFSAGATCTLAKAASELAKSHPEFKGLCVLDGSRPDLLGAIAVGDVWNIGRRTAPKLQAMGINTALDLARADRLTLRRMFGVVVERTHLELNGQPCVTIAEHDIQSRKQIFSTRSLKEKPTTLADLQLQFAERVGEVARKLRENRLLVQNLQVFMATSPFNARVPRFNRSEHLQLPSRTLDYRDLAEAVATAVARLYREGIPIARVGVGALDPVPAAEHQLGLFDPPGRADSDRLMKAVCEIQGKYGSPALRFGNQAMSASALDNGARHSPRSLTRWSELASAR